MPPIVQKIGVIASLVILFGGILTFAMTWKSIGFSDGFLLSWLSSFLLCVLCIAPIGGLIAMLLTKTLNAAFPALGKLPMNLLFGLCMAIIMESVMSAVTTANLHGLLGGQQFYALWLSTLLTALPIGIVFSVLISLILKPKIETFWAR